MTENGLGPAWPQRPALFLDLDGTLLEFAETPDDVELTPRFQGLLVRLGRLDHGAIAFISGRTMEKLDRILAPHRFALAGVHGSQRRRPDGSIVHHEIDSTALEPLREELRQFERIHPGVLLEDKGISLAVHYRKAPHWHAAVAQLASRIAETLPAGLGLLDGDHVLEIRPSGLDKGAAIRAFMNEAPFAGRTPVFVGDDVTDEAGFRAVNELGGVSVKVDGGATVANWRLSDIAAVFSWLEANIPN